MCRNYFANIIFIFSSCKFFKMENAMSYCPCGNALEASACCLRFIIGPNKPPSAEALMRSRYTAFALGKLDYIQKTMRPPASNVYSNELEHSAPAKAPIKWLKLNIIKAYRENGIEYVEFEAYFQDQGSYYKMHELSQFSLQDATWYYVDAKQHTTTLCNPNRNEPCWCSSGKKFKKCCGR